MTEALRQFVELIRSPSGDARPGSRGLRRAWRRRAARGPHARRPAVRLPRGRAGRLAASGRRRHARGRRARGAQPARRVDLRLHRGAVGRLGRGLRGGSLAARGRAPPPAPRAGDRCSSATRRPRRPTCEPRPRRRAGVLPRTRGGARVRRGAGSSASPRGCPPTPLAAALDGDRLRDHPRPRRPRPPRRNRSSRLRGPRRVRRAGPDRSACASSAPPGRSRARRCGPSRPGRSRQPALRPRGRRAHRAAAVRERRAWSSGSRARRLAPLDALTPKARRRMEETALAYVQQQGNAAAMARALGVHRADGALPTQPPARVAGRRASTTPTLASSSSWRCARGSGADRRRVLDLQRA